MRQISPRWLAMSCNSNMKKPALVILFMLFSLAMLSSCATRWTTVMKQYENAPVCCKGFSEFEYEKINLDDSKKFTIDDKSMAFLFDTGKSYFKAFELPEYSSPYTITITSYMSAGLGTIHTYIFRPVVMFLDETYNPTRVEKDIFMFGKTNFSEGFWENTSRKFEGKVLISHKYTNERYMLIFTTDHLLTGRVSIDEMGFFPVPIGPAGALLWIPTGMKRVSYPHSPVGSLKMVISKIDPTSLLDEPSIKGIENGDIQTAMALISERKVNAVNEKGQTPLFIAAKNGRIEVIKLLIKAGADLGIEDYYGWSPVDIATYNSYYGIVNILNKAGAGKNRLSQRDVVAARVHLPPVMMAAIEDNAERLRNLINGGADVNMEVDGVTPLMLAVELHNVETVNLLLKAGADVNRQNKDELDTSLMIAALNGHDDIVNILLDKGADMEKKISKKRGMSFTALMIATYLDDRLPVVKSLIEAGANVNAKGNDGKTALIFAAIDGQSQIETIKILFNSGADINAEDIFGNTPLIYAAIAKHSNVVVALIKAGANINKKNREGKTALIFARESGNSDVVRILEEAGAD